MKRLLMMIFLTAITASAFCQNGVIRELTGEVELKHAGATAFVRANAGDTVAPSTIVSTGFRSTTIIAVGNSVITVQPLTRLSLAEIQTAGNAENVRLDLQAGRVRVDVNPPAGTQANFSVQTPSATASVRGTSFEMDAETITVHTGRVIYTGTAGTAAIVTGGNAGSVNMDGTPANPVEIAEASLEPPPPVDVPSTKSASTAGGESNVTVDLGYSNEY
jgi:hypothetical protein